MWHLTLAGGTLALAACPGRNGFDADLAAIRDWRPALVLSLTTPAELRDEGAAALPAALAHMGIAWVHHPIPDYGLPGPDWPALSARLHALLAQGQRVLIHCRAGCGRSGTVALRLMVEAGEDPAAALTRLRQTRPCAVETEGQRLWASHPSPVPLATDPP